MHTILILVISFVALLWAANHLVTGAAGLSLALQISPFIVSLTIVALGTSLPQLIILTFSSLKYKNHLVTGNIIGINIANIGLVLGLSILIKPMFPKDNPLKKIYPLLIITMLFTYSLILDGVLGRIDGCLFLIAGIALIGFSIYLSNQNLTDAPFNDFKSAISSQRSVKINCLSVLLGLFVLPLSSKYLTHSAMELASWIQLSEYTTHFTIVAIGATLPGLATAIVAALKEEEDIAAGTILGSNLYNLLLIIAFPALIIPAKISATFLWRELSVLGALLVLLLFLNYHYQKKLSPWHGGILIIIYCSYLVSLVIKAHS